MVNRPVIYSIVLCLAGLFSMGCQNHSFIERQSASLVSEGLVLAPYSNPSEIGSFTPSGYDMLLVSATCCKVCRKGKACGNSCISRSYSCSKPPGCACDG